MTFKIVVLVVVFLTGRLTALTFYTAGKNYSGYFPDCVLDGIQEQLGSFHGHRSAFDLVKLGE